MSKVNWAEVVASTPATLRTAAIIVLLGVLVVFGAVLSAAVWKGRSLGVLGIGEYREPDVQKCEQLVGALTKFNAINEDLVKEVGTQIAALRAAVQANILEAARINNTGGYNSAAIQLRDYAAQNEKKIESLEAKQNNILKDRTKLVQDVVSKCGRKSQ